MVPCGTMRWFGCDSPSVGDGVGAFVGEGVGPAKRAQATGMGAGGSRYACILVLAGLCSGRGGRGPRLATRVPTVQTVRGLGKGRENRVG